MPGPRTGTAGDLKHRPGWSERVQGILDPLAMWSERVARRRRRLVVFRRALAVVVDLALDQLLLVHVVDSTTTRPNAHRFRFEPPSVVLAPLCCDLGRREWDAEAKEAAFDLVDTVGMGTTHTRPALCRCRVLLHDIGDHRRPPG